MDAPDLTIAVGVRIHDPDLGLVLASVLTPDQNHVLRGLKAEARNVEVQTANIHVPELHKLQ